MDFFPSLPILSRTGHSNHHQRLTIDAGHALATITLARIVASYSAVWRYGNPNNGYLIRYRSVVRFDLGMARFNLRINLANPIVIPSIAVRSQCPAYASNPHRMIHPSNLVTMRLMGNYASPPRKLIQPRRPPLAIGS